MKTILSVASKLQLEEHQNPVMPLFSFSRTLSNTTSNLASCFPRLICLSDFDDAFFLEPEPE